MIKGLIESSRPKTLLVGAAPVLLGSAYSYANFNNFKIEIFLLNLAKSEKTKYQERAL